MTSVAQSKVDLSQGHSRARNVHEAFEKLRQLGHGTYGEVYLARDRYTQEQVALKKIKLEASKERRQGFPITALREMRVLKQLNHPNVVQLKEVCRSNSALSPCSVQCSPFPIRSVMLTPISERLLDLM
jgi:cyclin-dependent kinase 12/13